MPNLQIVAVPTYYPLRLPRVRSLYPSGGGRAGTFYRALAYPKRDGKIIYGGYGTLCLSLFQQVYHSLLAADGLAGVRCVLQAGYRLVHGDVLVVTKGAAVGAAALGRRTATLRRPSGASCPPSLCCCNQR